MSGNISVEGFTALASVLVATGGALTLGRFVLHRNSSSRALHASDILNGAAALTLIALLALQSRYLPLNLALQAWALREGPPISPNDLETYFHVEVALFLLFWVVLYLVKFSFLMLYHSFFAISKPFRMAWWGVVAFTAVAFGVDFFSILWICGTPEGLFDIRACSSRQASLVGHNILIVGAVFNVLSDVAIMGLPLGMLRGLRVRGAQRAGLAVVFALGALTIAADVVRIVANFTLTVKTTFNMLEPTVAVMVCALPSYRRFLGAGAAGGGSGSGVSRWLGGLRARFSSGRGSSGLPAKELPYEDSLSDGSSAGARPASRGSAAVRKFWRGVNPWARSGRSDGLSAGKAGSAGSSGHRGAADRDLHGHAIPRAQMTGMGTYIDRYGRTQKGMSGMIHVSTAGYAEYETQGALEPVRSQRGGDMV